MAIYYTNKGQSNHKKQYYVIRHLYIFKKSDTTNVKKKCVSPNTISDI